MSNQNHPWIQDFASFEAVLCCTHELGQWEPSSTLRAYQTYGFDDASTPGNDQTFRHIDTGVLLLHDGEVVAIQFGDGNLSAALSDLFLVLNALGWKEAEVYHPSETLPALLHDMGKAIPGHMEFDVKGAIGASDSGRLPEAATLIERGKSLLQGVASGAQEVQNFNQLALGELESMAPDHVSNAAVATDAIASQPMSQSTVIAPTSAPVHLEEDFDLGMDNATSGRSLLAQEPASGGRPHGQVFLDDDDSGPVVPVLGVSTLQSTAQNSQSGGEEVYAGNDAPIDAPLETVVHTNAGAASVEEHEQVGLQAEVPVVQPVKAVRTESALRAVAAVESPVVRALTHGGMGEDAESRSLIRVGKSALSFDLPDAPVTLADVSRCASQLGAVEVVHLWPGLINQSERWDLIGEIDPNAPWFAEVVANELAPQEAVERVWFAASLLELRRQQDRAQPRDW
ncbi:hypothetical protein AU476_01200 [Cupriavidus sp. UYMSc13B]|nr:hypothetical protein AU476_01200 [Cupriavidus sp. UYMSc13B]